MKFSSGCWATGRGRGKWKVYLNGASGCGIVKVKGKTPEQTRGCRFIPTEQLRPPPPEINSEATPERGGFAVYLQSRF